MRRFLLSISLIGFFALGGCDKFSTVQHFTLDPSIKAFFNYNDGSRWNYVLESDTNVKEVVTVQGHKEGKMVWDAFTQEFFDYDLVSDRDSSLKLRAIADENNVCRAALLVKDTSYKQVVSWYYTGGFYSGANGNQDTLDMRNQVTINGINYSNVLVISPASNPYYRKLYFAKNIGIIRKELTGGKVYTLRSYSVQ